MSTEDYTEPGHHNILIARNANYLSGEHNYMTDYFESIGSDLRKDVIVIVT